MALPYFEETTYDRLVFTPSALIEGFQMQDAYENAEAEGSDPLEIIMELEDEGVFE
jgi:hypothetical protein